MFKSAIAHSEEVIFYFDFLGNKYVAQGGSLAWRLNNPGLVRSHSHFSRKNGSIGSLKGVAIFSSPEQGHKALIDLLETKKYFNSTLKTIGKLYLPTNPEEYASRLASSLSISLEKKINSFSKEEFKLLILTIEKSCGYCHLGNEQFVLLPKIYAHIESNQGKDLYLIGSNTLLSKEDVIEWISTHRLDGVLVHQNDGNIYIRSRPAYAMWNIHMPADGIPALEGEIDTLMRVVGEKRENQCIWAFINGVWNPKENALKSARLISDSTDGEQVLSMPNDMLGWSDDVGVCILLKIGMDTPVVHLAVKFLKHLLFLSSEGNINLPIVVFAHSMGAIICEHALELLTHQERQKIRVFTFGGGSFISPGKCHQDSHNFASAKDLICFCGSPNFRTLAMQRYIAIKEGLTHEQMLEKWAREDSMLYLDTIDVRVIQNFEKQRIKYYEELLEKICNVTILDSGPEYEHSFCNECYQKKVQTLIEKYKKISKPPRTATANIIAMDCITV
jgi:hypothetical protein